jgi:hypothetical protein
MVFQIVSVVTTSISMGGPISGCPYPPGAINTTKAMHSQSLRIGRSILPEIVFCAMICEF